MIQIGGLGDLVLASETIARLKQARPGWHISLMCRAEVAPVVDLYPVRPDEVVELAFNPYGWDAPSEELYAALEPVLPILQSLDPDLLIAASLQPTWFSWFAIAATQARAAVCCTRSAEPVSFLDLVLRRFGLSRRPVRRIEPEPDTHERSRYGLILKNLHVRPKAGFPWALHHHLEREASLRLTDLGLQERRYFVCFPTGSENTKIKRWPEDRFVEVLTDITGELELPVLLIGETADEPQLSRIAGALASHGGEAKIFCGRRQDIPLLGGLVSMASGYLGNDTGPMHLASAYGVPGVAIYGGGYWLSYAPWGKGSIGLVHPLPCFGCKWDCAFGRGICVESIEPAAVLTAMQDVLAKPPAGPEVRTLHSVPLAIENIIRDASAQYRLVQEDRVQRLDVILTQNLALEQTEAARQMFEAAAQQRQSKLVELTAMVQERDRRIAELEKAVEERLAALKQTEAARQMFEAAAQQRHSELVEVTAAVQERDRRLTELEKAVEERLVALKQVEAARQDFETEARQLQAKLSEELIALRNEKLINFLLRRYKFHSDVPPGALR